MLGRMGYLCCSILDQSVIYSLLMALSNLWPFTWIHLMSASGIGVNTESGEDDITGVYR